MFEKKKKRLFRCGQNLAISLVDRDGALKKLVQARALFAFSRNRNFLQMER